MPYLTCIKLSNCLNICKINLSVCKIRIDGKGVAELEEKQSLVTNNETEKMNSSSEGKHAKLMHNHAFS